MLKKDIPHYILLFKFFILVCCFTFYTKAPGKLNHLIKFSRLFYRNLFFIKINSMKKA